MRTAKPILITLVALAVAAAAFFSWFHWRYPYGPRWALMSCTMSSLWTYANRHNGWFPRGMSNAVDCLRELVPNYLSASDLAGISGSVRKVQDRLDAGQPLDESVSSWVYWPGFCTNDPPELAILWDRAAGVSGNGERTSAGSHAAGFADGHWEIIAGAKWRSFLKQQEVLRSEALTTRASKSP